jgi:hypothetical protein
MSPSPEALDMHLVFSVQEEEHAEPTKYPTKNIALALRWSGMRFDTDAPRHQRQNDPDWTA